MRDENQNIGARERLGKHVIIPDPLGGNASIKTIQRQ
jgi:hypothetical protein